MPNSTKPDRPAKPRPDFPLFPHRNGKWARKVRGKFAYFGKWSDDQKGERAIGLWLDQKDALLAGRKPRAKSDGITLRDLINRFLTSKERQRDSGDITGRTFADYLSTCKMLVTIIDADRPVDDLAADDFEQYRSAISKGRSPTTLGNEVQRARVLFKYAYDAGLIDKPVRYGPTFKRPAKRILKAHRQKQGPNMFEADQLRAIIAAAPQPLKAMVLLGINAGFGNTDCGTLPKSAIDFDGGWVNFPRPKTASDRRCKLWPETITAIREALESRPAPKDTKDRNLVFITKYGGPWSKGTKDSPISAEFRKLLHSLDVEAAKQTKGKAQPIHRAGIGFYTCRRTCETIGGDSRDQVAIDHVMGHSDDSMAGLYRQKVFDERLVAVSDHIRRWLFPDAVEE